MVKRWKHHLLLSLTLWYAFGIILVSFYPGPLLPLSWTLLITCISGGLFWFQKRTTPALLLLSLSFLIFGAVRGHIPEKPILDDMHLAATVRQKTEVVVVGTLTRLVAHYDDISRAQVDLEFVRFAESGQFLKTGGTVLLTLQGQWPEAIMPGEALAARATLKPPFSNNTPGTFDYPEYLARKNIYLTGSIGSPLLVQPATLQKNTYYSLIEKFRFKIERLRTQIGQRIDRALEPETAGLYKALLIGDRSGINPAIEEAFKSSGIFHILAISGLHMGLLAMFIYTSIFWFLRRSERLLLNIPARKWAMVLSIPPLFLYTFLAGAQPPVLRSFVMTFFIMLALAADRLKSPMTILAAAALCILAYEPAALKTASFQLSFSAVAAIIMISPRLMQLPIRKDFRIHRQSPLMKAGLIFYGIGAVTLAATLGTLPLLLFHFHRLSLVTLPANLLVEPLIGLWSLPLGFLAVPLFLISFEAAALFLQFGAWGIAAAGKIALFLSGVNRAEVWLPSPEPAVIVLYYVFLILLCAPVQTRLSKAAAGSGLIATILVVFLPLTPLLNGFKLNTHITFIDVGHGSSTLVEYPGGRTLLVDGGTRSAPGYNCGERIIAPYLWYRRIARLDDIVITHDDADHYNGIAAVMRRFRPERLWLADNHFGKNGFNELIRVAAMLGVQIKNPDSHTNQDENKKALFFVGLSDKTEQSQTEPALRRNEDDNGLVVRIESQELSALLPGDISKYRELELVRSGQNLKADILLSAHHGSSTSNSSAFLAAVDPRYLIVSSADQTGRLFPSPHTSEAAEDLGISVLTTARDGTITVTDTGTGDFQILSYKNSEQTLVRGR